MPNIVFTKGAGAWLAKIAAIGCDAVGVDWTTDLKDARTAVDGRVALQGNLDPAVLLGGWPAVERAARAVVDDGRRAIDAGAAGHIFNLGHGVLPETDPGILTDLVSLVHSL